MAAPAAAVSAGAGAAAGKERDGLGLGSGGERALQAGKRFRTAPGDIVLKIGSEKDRLRIFNDMTNDVHIGSWLDTSSAAKAAFVETERCKCKICKTTKQYVKMSDMRAHADGPMHKKKAGEMVVALRLKAKRMAALGVEVVKDTKLVPHEVAARARVAAHGMLIALGYEDMYPKLLLVASLIDQMDFLIVMSSRDDSTFSNSLIKDILSVGEGLRSAAADPESSYFLAPVLEKLGADYPAEKKAMLFGYANVAVQNMTAKYRHVEEWSDTLRKKVMWDHRVPDYNDTLVLGKKVKAADGSSVDDKRLTAGWFGMTKQPTMAFIGQWNLWVGEARTKEELALEPGEYWRSKDKSYPLLYKLGLWYAAIPLSAVSAERAIGLMREVETPKRNSMKKASWHAECFLRYNKWLTEGIFDDVSGDVATLHKCIKSPQAASAAAAVEAAAAAADAPFCAPRAC